MTPQHTAGVLALRNLADRSRARQVLAVLLGTAFLALSSRLEVPMIPVPMTMQTYAVPLIGALYGWRLGGITVVAWLLEAAVGMPVLAGGASGIARFAGPTAGYLFSFPLMAILVGYLAERGWTRNPLHSFGVMLAANAMGLALGAFWLAHLMGVEKAWLLGVAPFIVGGVLKSALGAATTSLVGRVGPALRRP